MNRSDRREKEERNKTKFKRISQFSTSTQANRQGQHTFTFGSKTIHHSGLNSLKMTMTFQCVNHQLNVSCLGFWSLVQTPFTGLLGPSCVVTTLHFPYYIVPDDTLYVVYSRTLTAPGNLLTLDYKAIKSPLPSFYLKWCDSSDR